MTDFLLELRCEEIPARMQKQARAELEKLFRAQMAEAGLETGALTIWSTPRRLTLIARDMPLETKAVQEERKGPRADAPAQALEGFLRSTGMTRDQLEEREDKKGVKILFAVIDKPGRPTKDVLAEAIPAIIRAFAWPKSMRWGAASQSSESLRWVRPLSGIVAILGEELVPCEVDGIASHYDTLGHRFHHQGPITIGSAADYQEKLRACHVIVDHEEREAMIREGAARAAADAGLDLVADEGLVIENAGLTEWPVPLLGGFAPTFLDVPEEVIQLTARINQKYFICRAKDGTLAPNFICTANISAHDGGAAIVAGNEKVLAARLSDAKFFWELDQKTRLEDHAKKLGRITFHEKLGSVADKVARVAKLAEWLAAEGYVPDCDPALARQAAELCKADLVTEMVGEFPELQGVMGGYYAAREGLPAAVSDAIRDHYKPVGQGDAVPTAPVTVAVALADKLDSITQFFGIDEKPTGSKDPFALRRAAIGVNSLIQANALDVPISAVDAGGHGVLAFMVDRLKVQQKEAGVRHDLIDAVFALGEENQVRLLKRVGALQSFVATEDGANLLAGYKRAANILKKEAADGLPAAPDAGAYALEPAEAALVEALDMAEPRADAAIAAEDFEGAMAALALLRAPIDGFFDHVTVNDADPVKRAARLSLLARIRAAVHKVADFSKIEG